MSRITVTPALADTLRTLRVQNQIQAKFVASKIGKSSAFVSRLESGKIKSIDEEDLSTILDLLSNGDSPVELADLIYKSLTHKHTQKEIEEELWYVNYETVYCQLPVPDALIDWINTMISDLGISRQYLAHRINSNEALTKEEIENDSIPCNLWYHPESKPGNHQSIKIKLSETQLNSILDKMQPVSSYVFILSIIFYLLKIKSFGDEVELTNEQNATLMREATTTLAEYKFYTISEKNQIITSKETLEEANDVLNSFDKKNIEIIRDIISEFRIATEQNIDFTNRMLNLYRENLHWDLGFMLKLTSLNYNSLEKTSFSNKKELISEIEKLVKKYTELPDELNKFESY